MFKKETQRIAKLMAGSPLDDYIAAAARALDLPIEPAWMPAVKANLEVTLRLATVVADFELPDTTEPAPIFRV